MKKILSFLSIGLFSTILLADTKISELPLGNATLTHVNDSFPYVDSSTKVTKRLKLSDLLNLPTLQAEFLVLVPDQTGQSGKCLESNGSNTVWSTCATGTVTSVGLLDGSSAPIYTITGSPVTSSGSLTFTLATETANKVFAGPTTGSAAQPTFRSLVPADLPVADASNNGAVSTTTQTFAGNKTFNGSVFFKAGGGSNVASIDNSSINIFSGDFLNLWDNTNTNAIGLFAPASVSAAYDLKFPAAQGGASTILVNDGSGNFSWVTNTTGTVTSVAMTVPSFLSIAGSPVTTTGTLAVSLSGTALPVANGGTGQTTLTNHGVLVGAGTSGITQLSAATAGTLLTGQGASDPSFSATPTLGVNATTTGQLLLASGGGSGQSVTVQNRSTTSAWNFNLPTTAGSSGTVLTSAGGGSSDMTWSSVLSNPMTTVGDIIYENASPAPARLGANATATNKYLQSVSSGVPTWQQIAFADISGTADLTSQVTGTLPVANGGTGRATLTNHGLLVGATTTAITQLAAAGAGTMLQGVAASDPAFSSTPTLGLIGTATGKLNMTGTTSGTITIQPQDAAGTYNFNLPTTAGSSGQVLTSAAGGSSPMTWSTALTNPMDGAGQMIYGGTAGVATKVVAGTSGQVPISAGTTVAFGTLQGNSTALKAPTFQVFTSTGSQTGWLFNISTSSTVAVGDTYTNNSNTYTVQGALTAQTGNVLFMSGTGATSGTTLTRATGSGTSSITFNATKIATGTYTTATSPGPLFIKVRMVGGGGGGCGSGTASCGAGNPGTDSFFGANILDSGPGLGATQSSCVGTGGVGGSATISSPATTIVSVGGMAGSGREYGGTLNGQSGTYGGSSYFGGGGNGGLGAAVGGNAVANSGSGGGGAGVGSSTAGAGSGGGGASSYVEAMISSPAATYPIIVGVKGTGGTAGTSGAAGGDGADGRIIVEEYYQ